MPTEHTAEELMHRLYEDVFGRGELTLLEQIFAPNFIDHSTPEQAAGISGVAAYVASVRTGFPDLQVLIEDIVQEKNRIAFRTTWLGTHLGIYEGITPTGKPARRTLMQFFVLADGKIAEEWNEGSALLTSSEETEPPAVPPAPPVRDHHSAR